MSVFRDSSSTAPATLINGRDHGREGRVAVIDVGSSTLRLVVYETPARLPVPIFNEKADCGLGRGLEHTGNLNKEGVARAFSALSRFVHLARSMDVERLDVIATAAVRDAADGLKFAEEIESRFDINVQILSGAEEARLAGLGLLSGIPEADGILGDLGGGSLDLIALDKGQFGANATFPVGHLRLPDAVEGDISRAAGHVDQQLSEHKWLKKARGRTLFAVGGSWRAMARIYIEQTNYPVHIIDGFTLAGSDMRRFAKLISGLSVDSLQQMHSVRGKRIETLAFAAVVMDRLLKVTRPKEIVFSGYGMREGQMLKGLPADIRGQDPLIAGCESLAERSGRFTLSGFEMFKWMTPLFPEEKPDLSRLRYAACLLSDIGWQEHPDYRAEHSFFRALRVPFAGLTHPDRAYLAKAVFIRYKGDPDEEFAAKSVVLMKDGYRRHAKAVGLALRLAHTISGSAPGHIGKTELQLTDGKIALMVSGDEREVLVGEAVERRMKALGKALGHKKFEVREI